MLRIRTFRIRAYVTIPGAAIHRLWSTRAGRAATATHCTDRRPRAGSRVRQRQKGPLLLYGGLLRSRGGSSSPVIPMHTAAVHARTRCNPVAATHAEIFDARCQEIR